MIKKEHLQQKVLVHDVSNWIHETKSIGVNNKWNLFKKLIQENDELWSYSIVDRYSKEQGYCLLRNGNIVNKFETARQ